MKFETKLIHGGQSEDQATGAVSIPVYRSSTFHQYELGGNPEWEYSRTGNPTRASPCFPDKRPGRCSGRRWQG